MDDFENLFSDEVAEEINEIVEDTEDEVAETVDETVEETAEDEAEPVDETAEAEIESETSTVEEPAKEAPETVPVSVMLAQRARAKAAEQELVALRQQMAASAAKQVQPADPYDDPERFRQEQLEAMRFQVQEELRITKLQDSVIRGREKYGQETLDEVAEWAESMAAQDPTFEFRAMSAPDPVEWTLAERKRSEQRQLFETDPDAFVRQRAIELGLTATPQVAAHNNTTMITEARKASPGPKSLVHASSRQPTASKSGKDEFQSLFDK
ncbi:hypothetical protein OKW76_00455 [Sphingomonas sp. S1-29]|uniref:hypothetical protein n=1 Tax=Sphingomonas sp. S1-29 TaxID=2991074 RepID=UPI00223F3D90|nr:hypothetical protein [Sphingomonas sp. S1-29]UZK69596.1 hypothetical protein OKW76_00455 [Sphingomonas sp. S1-29]